jgi:hypothetical protein
MNTDLDFFSLFEGMEWAANKQDILQYATDNGFVDDVFELINSIDADDDYYFSSINDLINKIGEICPDDEEGGDCEDYKSDGFNEENFDTNVPLE